MTAAFVVIFPLVGGIPFTFSLVAIPVLYVYLCVPAALTGLTTAILMLSCKRTFRPGTLKSALLASLIGSVYMAILLAIFRFPGVIATFFAPRHAATGGELIMRGAIQAMIVVSLAFLVLAGGATSLAVRGKRIESLLDEQS